jgi:protein-tyrosine-phosphatase
MGEVLFKQYIYSQGYSQLNWEVASAGCWARPDQPATKNAILTTDTYKCNLWLHSSQAVSEYLLKYFNLVLCMESEHRDFIKRNFPEMAEKVFLLSNMIDADFNIDDPVGGTIETYAITAEKFMSIFIAGFSQIKNLSAQQANPG